jgi:ubiquinone biosynthesis protein
MIETMFLHRRHAGRYRQIVRVLLSHGLGGLIAPFDPRGRRAADVDVDGEDGVRPGRVTRTRARHLRQALEQLGPAFIKLGQILSTRADILPPLYIQELGLLLDSVTPDPASAIREVIERELGDSVETLFAEFDDVPIAAASIGQVHAARLHDGGEVIVKVQRPGVDRQIQEDLFILADVARIAEGRSKMLRESDLSGLVREFSWTIRAELDYLREGRNADRFQRAFEHSDVLRIPVVHWDFTTPKVLTLERIDGIGIDDVAALRSAGHDVERLNGTMIRMLARGILDIGLFHADPHPGNFVVDEHGALVVYDFGMVGSIDERLRERLLMLALACTERDASRIVDEVVQLGVVPSGWDRRSMERDVSHLVAQYVGVPLHELPLPMLVGDIMTMMRRHRMRLPSELLLLAKTATTAEAVGRRLDPNLNVIELVEPTIRAAMRRFYSPTFWKERLRMRPLEVALLGASLPGHIQRILSRIDRNDLTFHIQYDELPDMMRGLNGMVNRLAMAIMSAAGLIGVAVMFLAVQPVFGSWQSIAFLTIFVLLGLMILIVLIRVRQSGR